LIVLLSTLAFAGPAEDLLGQVDAAINPSETAHLVLGVDTVDNAGRASTRTLEVWQKGDDKRLVRFTEPARVAGIALLVPDADTLYLYLPSYGRPRRIIGTGRGDAFFGTNFAMEDLARTRWGDEWTPTLVEPNHLRLTPKDASEHASARVELWARPSDHLPERIEHYDDDGTLLRRIVFTDVRPVGSKPLSHGIVVEDAAHGRTTRATVRVAELDVAVADQLFTLTELQP
jgi:outer membrane lipoprotein-sorting protein